MWTASFSHRPVYRSVPLQLRCKTSFNGSGLSVQSSSVTFQLSHSENLLTAQRCLRASVAVWRFMESSMGNKLWGALQARLDCSALLHRGHRHSARLLRSLKQLERRRWDLDALVGLPAESLMTRAAQTDRHAGLTGKWRWVFGSLWV